MFSMTGLALVTLPWLWQLLGMSCIIFNSGHSLSVFYNFVAELSAIIQLQNMWFPEEQEYI
jgi:hypothetical protein